MFSEAQIDVLIKLRKNANNWYKILEISNKNIRK